MKPRPDTALLKEGERFRKTRLGHCRDSGDLVGVLRVRVTRPELRLRGGAGIAPDNRLVAPIFQKTVGEKNRLCFCTRVIIADKQTADRLRHDDASLPLTPTRTGSARGSPTSTPARGAGMWSR